MLASKPATARFNHDDADHVDAEEHNNTETWNDKNSYRYPRSWVEFWRQVDVGYRASAGSLNASRFSYDEDIKIKPDPLATFTAGFQQSRREDLVEQNLEREIRLGWAFLPTMRISLLGDGDTFKEFGDLGMAFALHEDNESKVEVYYWNVDNYYKSKKSDENAYRLVDSQTWGVTAESAFVSGALLTLKLENDSPLDWHYPAAGFEYDYWRKWGEFNLEWPLAKGLQLYVSSQHEIKMEHKTSLVLPGISKRMLRRASVSEAGVETTTSDEFRYLAGLQYVRRVVDYKNGGDTSESPAWRESRSPEAVHRHEWGLQLNRYGKVNDHLGIQHGVYANDVFISEDERQWKTLEVKYQFLLDMALNSNTRLGVNTTWDVDQVVRDFPYSRKAPFRPWGGGDLQFLMKL